MNNLIATSSCSPDEQRILLLMPTGKDARLSQSFLAEAGLACTICANITTTCAELEAGAGVLVVTEEALAGEGMRQLQAALAHQPAWSDLPIVVLTSGGNSTISAYALENLGNVMLLDRPVHIATLISTIRTALRARLRQYQIRELRIDKGGVHVGPPLTVFQGVLNGTPQYMGYNDLLSEQPDGRTSE